MSSLGKFWRALIGACKGSLTRTIIQLRRLQGEDPDLLRGCAEAQHSIGRPMIRRVVRPDNAKCANRLPQRTWDKVGELAWAIPNWQTIHLSACPCLATCLPHICTCAHWHHSWSDDKASARCAPCARHIIGRGCKAHWLIGFLLLLQWPVRLFARICAFRTVINGPFVALFPFLLFPHYNF